METKVIQLPRTRTWKNRFHERKASVAVSLAAVLVFSLAMNQWLLEPSTGFVEATGARQIASVGASLEDYRKQVQWEQALANEVAESNSQMAHLAERPSLRDQLLYGDLGGRYDVSFDEGRVAAFEFNAGRVVGEPTSISDYEGFLQEYRGVWKADFAEVRLESRKGKKIIYSLLTADNRQTGQVELDLDQNGQLLKLKFTK